MSRSNFYGICRDQLFFISFARIWARAMKPAEAVSFANISHSKAVSDDLSGSTYSH